MRLGSLKRKKYPPHPPPSQSPPSTPRLNQDNNHLNTIRKNIYIIIKKKKRQNADAAGPLEGWSTYGGYARLPRITVNVKSPRKPCLPPVRTPKVRGSSLDGVFFIWITGTDTFAIALIPGSNTTFNK